mgnify:CR=1 FL=1
MFGVTNTKLSDASSHPGSEIFAWVTKVKKMVVIEGGLGEEKVKSMLTFDSNLTDEDIAFIAEYPTIEQSIEDTLRIKKNEITKGINIIDIVIKSKLLKSKNEVRRAIKNLGVKVNNITIDEASLSITINDFKENILKLSHGKKNHVLFKIIN